MELSASDNGTRQRIAQGETISLLLAENPTTGYRWQLLTREGDLLVVADDFAAAGPAMGSPGQRTFVLQPQRTGEIELHLVNRRSWEPADKPAAGEFTLVLDVG